MANWPGQAAPVDPDAPFVPRRSTSETELDQWNQAWRQSPLYLDFMRRHNLPTDGRVRLSRSQQAALEREMNAAGLRIPGGMHIDQGGNLNQKNRLGKVAGIGAAAGLATFGLPGVFPGLLSGGAGAAGAAGGTLPSTSLGGALMGGGQFVPLGAAGGAGALGGAAGAAGAAAGAGEGGGALARALGGAAGAAGNPWLNALITGLAGLPGLIGGQKGPSAEEQALQEQVRRLLASQERRQTYQNPLYEAVTRLAYNRLPTGGTSGLPFPPGSLEEET